MQDLIEDILSRTPASFTSFLTAADTWLDLRGIPVAFRRKVIVYWCAECDTDIKGTELRGLLRKGLKDIGSIEPHSGYSAILHWYLSVYGEMAYRTPFLALVGPISKNQFFEIKLGAPDQGILLPKTSALRSLEMAQAAQALVTDDVSRAAVFAMRNMPITNWSRLAAAEYDSSIAALFSARPSYHLSMWHSHQVAEKFLKSVLALYGWSPTALSSHVNHHLPKAEAILGQLGYSFSKRASQALSRINRKCGPNIRYSEDDSPSRREVLRTQAYSAHRDLLTFAADAMPVLREAVTNAPSCIEGSVTASDTEAMLAQEIFREFLVWANDDSSIPYLLGNEGLRSVES